MAKEKSRDIISVGSVKRWFRRMLIQDRQAISPVLQKRWSKLAVRNLLKTPHYKKAKVIAPFIGFGSEMLTHDLIQQAWKDGKQVVIPMTSDGFHKPFFALFRKGDRLKKTTHGPLELHRKSKAFPFGSIDLVVVPGLGFDRDGYRLGYGGGVYDRILNKTPRAKHVGLFYSNQFVSVLPREKHDKKMTSIVTEKGVQSPPWHY